MLLVQTLEQFFDSSVYISNPTKNTILDDGIFTRYIQSSDCCVFNSISINIVLTNVLFEQYFNKKKCSFKIDENIDVINKLILIEEQLLNKFNQNQNKNKTKVFTLKSQLEKSFIKKCYLNNNQKNLNNKYDKINIIFKISGVWEDPTQYGLTFRFIIMN